MVFIKDEGSVFDAPIDVLWKYIQSPAHGQAHRSIRNRQTQPAGENTQLASMERNVGGSWLKVVNRLTILPPLGIAFEALEGPFAGSKFVYIYTRSARRRASRCTASTPRPRSPGGNSRAPCEPRSKKGSTKTRRRSADSRRRSRSSSAVVR